MKKITRNIGVRQFNGSAVPVGSEIGKILINSTDSGIVVEAIRNTIKNGKSETVILSPSTKKALKYAKGYTVKRTTPISLVEVSKKSS